MPDDTMIDHPNVAELERRFAALGAKDPRTWAQSQVEEGIPQLARFLFLREAWRRVVDENDPSWIESEVKAAQAEPDAPYAGVGRALSRLRALGASDHDLTGFVRGMQANLLVSLCSLLDDPALDEPEASGVCWALCQITEEGEILGGIPALHESVLETDPTGREMRPRPESG